jgi:hypothetical protein
MSMQKEQRKKISVISYLWKQPRIPTMARANPKKSVQDEDIRHIEACTGAM